MLTKRMNIDGYGPLKSPVKGGDNVHYMSRADARKIYDNTIDKIPERIEALRYLCEQNGYTNDPAGWTALVADHVEVERLPCGRAHSHGTGVDVTTRRRGCGDPAGGVQFQER